MTSAQHGDLGQADLHLGVLRREENHLAVSFERWFEATAADLWDAMTAPQRLTRWFAPVDGDLRETGAYRVDFGEDAVTTGHILICRAPEHLLLTWDFPGHPASSLSAHLRGQGGGAAVLALEHTRLPADQAIGYSAGWHAHLARLAAHLSGSALPEWDEAFADALPAYRRSGSAVVQPPTMDA